MSRLDEISRAIGRLEAQTARAEQDRSLIIESIKSLKTAVELRVPQQDELNKQIAEMYPVYKRGKRVFWIGAGVWMTLTGLVGAAAAKIGVALGWSKP